jgi:hypothetical protein
MILDIVDADNQGLIFQSKFFTNVNYNRDDQHSGVLCQFRDRSLPKDYSTLQPMCCSLQLSSAARESYWEVVRMTKSVVYYGSPRQAQLKAEETLDKIDRTSLNRNYEFIWQYLQRVDQSA